MKPEEETDVKINKLTIICVVLNVWIGSDHLFLRSEGISECEGVLDVVDGHVSRCHVSEFMSDSDLAQLFEGNCLSEIGHVGIFQGSIKGIR